MVASSTRGGFNTYRPSSTTRTTKTTVREFDADERCVKETVTEVTETTHSSYDPYLRTYQQPLIGGQPFTSGGTWTNAHTTYTGSKPE